MVNSSDFQSAYLSVLIVSSASICLLSIVDVYCLSMSSGSSLALLVLCFLLLFRAFYLSPMFESLLCPSSMPLTDRLWAPGSWNVMISSTSGAWFLWSRASVSNPMFVKSIRVLADLMACRYFLAIISIRKDWAIDQATRRSSSSISTKATWKTIERRKSTLHKKTIRTSSLFQILFLFK